MGGGNISSIAYSGLIQEFLLGEGGKHHRLSTEIFGIFARGGGKHIDCILWVNSGIFGIFARGGGKHHRLHTLG